MSEVSGYSDLRLVRAYRKALAAGPLAEDSPLLVEVCSRVPLLSYTPDDGFLSARDLADIECFLSHVEEMEALAAAERARGHQDALDGRKPRGSSANYMAGYSSVR